ncbi:MAG: hypothetical protein ABW178_05390 [Pseudoxanthomonas sp.]
MIRALPRWLHARARRVLPAAVRTVSAEVHASCTSLTALLLPLRRRSDGAVLFHLQRDTCQALRHDPSAVLSQAEMPPRGIVQEIYRPWRSVLAPPLGLVHFTSRKDGRAWLVLVPDDATALYVWRD